MKTPHEKAKEVAGDLGKLFDKMVDEMPLEDLIPFYRAEIKSIKRLGEHNPLMQMSDEKIAALEKAVDDFEMTYRAEKAEAEKMPLSWHEARRVRRLFEEADDDNFEPLEQKKEN